MKRIKRVLVCGLVWLAAMSVRAETNLCFNGGFTSTNEPLEGWTIDYAWSGSSVYSGNKSTVSYLPEFNGKKHVMKIVPSAQSKVECKPIKFEQGCRYRCSLYLYGGGMRGGWDWTCRFYFTGYMWRPGVAPYDDPEIKDFRRVLKGKPWVGKTSAWTPVTFEFPMTTVSELENKHLKKVRYITAYLLENSGAPTYIADVKIIKLPGTYTVKKGVPEESSSNPASKLGKGTAASRLGQSSGTRTSGSSSSRKSTKSDEDDSESE